MSSGSGSGGGAASGYTPLPPTLPLSGSPCFHSIQDGMGWLPDESGDFRLGAVRGEVWRIGRRRVLS